jgi:RNA polymerase sigma-70 factor (ECF subfamily)
MDRHDAGAERSDEDLLVAWHAGNAKDGQLLWERHSRSVMRFFRNKVPWPVAMDLAQRTLESGLRLRQPVRSFRCYLLGIARHHLLDYLRAEQRRRRRDTDLELLIVDHAVPSPEDWVCAKREKRVLLHALRRLPLPIQLVLELRYWEGLSDREIAEVMEVPIGTIKSRIATGRVVLRDVISGLVSSPHQLQSTLDSLDSWASRTRISRTGAQTDAGTATSAVGTATSLDIGSRTPHSG